MTQSIGIVGAKETGKNGKPRVCIDQKWYSADKVDMSSVLVGQRLDFEYDEWMWQNKPYRGVKNWGLSANQPSPEEAAAAAPQEKKPWAGKPGGGGFSPGKDRGLEIDLQCMRFVGQTVAALIEKDMIGDKPEHTLEAWTKRAYDAIKFAKSWGATAPAPVQTATPTGPPKQTPQGSSPTTTSGAGRVRPTGNFGWGTKHKDTPWNVMTLASLIWFRDESNAPADVKTRCRDEIFFREQDDQRAKALAPQTGPTEDFDEDIPF